MILIFVGLSIFIEDKLAALDKLWGVAEIIDASDAEFDAFLDIYDKIMLELLVPVVALFGFILFKKSKFN